MYKLYCRTFFVANLEILFLISKDLQTNVIILSHFGVIDIFCCTLCSNCLDFPSHLVNFGVPGELLTRQMEKGDQM